MSLKSTRSITFDTFDLIPSSVFIRNLLFEVVASLVLTRSFLKRHTPSRQLKSCIHGDHGVERCAHRCAKH